MFECTSSPFSQLKKPCARVSCPKDGLTHGLLCRSCCLTYIKEFLPGNKFRNNKIRREYEAKLERFVNSVLRNQKVSRLDKFILLCHGKEIKSCRSCKYSAFRGCILHALGMKPRVFAVCICKHKLLKNDEIFTCASLEDVMVGLPKRDRCFKIAPKLIHLPRLKTLILGYITVDDDFLSKLFLGCPVIEELSLQCCNLIVSKISSGTLKKLALSKCDILENLQICTPAIIDLVISTDGHRMGRVSLNEAGYLANAKIDFSSCLFHDHIYTEIAAEVINDISNVSSLNLTLSSTQV